jgi:hypothetical protein
MTSYASPLCGPKTSRMQVSELTRKQCVSGHSISLARYAYYVYKDAVSMPLILIEPHGERELIIEYGQPPECACVHR